MTTQVTKLTTIASRKTTNARENYLRITLELESTHFFKICMYLSPSQERLLSVKLTIFQSN